MKRLVMAILLCGSYTYAADTPKPMSAIQIKAIPVATDSVIINDSQNSNPVTGIPYSRRVLLSTLPISTPVQSALDGKANTSHSHSEYLTTEIDGSTTNELQTISIEGSVLTLSGGGGNVTIPSGGATAINDLSDVDTTGKSEGKVLKFDASGNLVAGVDETAAPGDGEANVQVDWNEVDTGSDAYIKNKPTTITTAQANAIVANTAKVTYPSADSSKLAGIAAGATANSSDATLLNRANHTGTQTASTISDFSTAVSTNAAVAANTAKISVPASTSTSDMMCGDGSGGWTTCTVTDITLSADFVFTGGTLSLAP